MNDTRLQRLEAELDDARATVADLEDDGFPAVPSIQDVRDRRTLQTIHGHLNHAIHLVHGLKRDAAS